MGFLGKIAPEHRQVEAKNIEQSLLKVQKAGDSLSVLAESVKNSEARYGQLSSPLISLTSNSTSEALFQAIRNDQLFHSKLLPVIDSVKTDQLRIVDILNQHGWDKSERENQQSGNALAKSSMLIAGNVRSTLENCLGKKAELEGTAITPLKEKVYEAFNILSLQETGSITSEVQSLMQLQETVEEQIQFFSQQYEREFGKEKPIPVNVDLSNSLIVSHTESQVQKMDALRSSLDDIQKNVDIVSRMQERCNSRVVDLTLRLHQLKALGKDFDRSEKVLKSALQEEKELALTAQEQLAILVNRKNQVEAMLADQRLPKELRTDKTLNGTKRMKLAAEAAQNAHASRMIAIRASNSVRISPDGSVKAQGSLVESIETELMKLDAPVIARAVNETGAAVSSRGHYGRFLTEQEFQARSALEAEVKESLRTLQ